MNDALVQALIGIAIGIAFVIGVNVGHIYFLRSNVVRNPFIGLTPEELEDEDSLSELFSEALSEEPPYFEGDWTAYAKYVEMYNELLALDETYSEENDDE